jgi:hypothetical protein
VLRHDVLTASYFVSNPNQDTLEHSRVTFRPPNS